MTGSYRGIRRLVLVRKQLLELVVCEVVLALPLVVLFAFGLVRPLERLSAAARRYPAAPLADPTLYARKRRDRRARPHADRHGGGPRRAPPRRRRAGRRHRARVQEPARHHRRLGGAAGDVAGADAGARRSGGALDRRIGRAPAAIDRRSDGAAAAGARDHRRGARAGRRRRVSGARWPTSTGAIRRRRAGRSRSRRRPRPHRRRR